MDKLDVRIIRELVQGEPVLSIWPARPFMLPAVKPMARRLGAAESTIRERQKKLHGFLPRWTLMVNPKLMGERLGAFAFEVPSGVPKEEILEKLSLVPDMLLIINYVGLFVFTSFIYGDEEGLEGKVELVKALSSCRESTFTEIPLPDCNARLTKTDFQIIASRQSEMSKTNVEVANELGISARTVKRRYASMARSGAIITRGHVSMEALRDCIRADLIVHYKEGQRARTETSILSLVDDYVMFNGHNLGWSDIDLIVPGVSVARQVLSQVKGLDGVASARMDIVESRFEFYNVFRRKVEERLRRLEA